VADEEERRDGGGGRSAEIESGERRVDVVGSASWQKSTESLWRLDCKGRIWSFWRDTSPTREELVLGDRTEALVYILRTSFCTCINNTGTQYTPASPWAGSRTHGPLFGSLHWRTGSMAMGPRTDVRLAE
jgi:hypothetical protein